LNTEPELSFDLMDKLQGSKKPGFFLKKNPNPAGFLRFIGFWVFLDKQEKIRKIIQKLSNLKP